MEDLQKVLNVEDSPKTSNNEKELSEGNVIMFFKKKILSYDCAYLLSFFCNIENLCCQGECYYVLRKRYYVVIKSYYDNV